MPVYYEVGQCFELFAMRVAVETGSRAIGVVECHAPRLLERARGGDADERTVQRAACESLVHDAILPRGEQQQGVGVPSRRSTPAILPVSVASPVQSRMSSVIWNAMPSAVPNSPSQGS